DDPNMTMEEYIKLEEEKARRRGRVFNCRTATYGKIKIDDDLHNLRFVEAKFPTIVINDAFAPQDALSCKSQVSTPVNDEIDFRISFDESDDEDYIIFCDKNLFSYKMISINNLKIDSENDNEKAGIPSFLPPEPTTSYVDDLDFFKYFENEFTAIVYNDARTSKSDYLTEHTLSPQHNNESNLNDETSLSEYDVVEQNVLYFNDLFPFNVIHPNDLKSDEDNDNKEIDIIQSSEGNEIIHGSSVLSETSRDKGLEYTDADITDFEERLDRIYSREIHRVQVVDFLGMPELMRDGLFSRMVMEQRDDVGVVLFTSGAWGRLFDTRGPLVRELIIEFLSTLRFGEVWLDLDAPGTIQFQLGRAKRRLSYRQFILDLRLHTGEEMDSLILLDFLGPSPSYTLIRDPVLRLSHRIMAHSIAGRSQAPEKILGGLTVIAPELSIIDMGELVRLQICMEVDDTWAWVAMGLERQPDAAAGALGAPPPPATARTIPQRMARLEEDIHEIHGALTKHREVIDAMARDFSRFSTWVITSLARMMDKAGVTYVPYSESHVPYQRRRVRQRTSKASTSAAQQDPQQPDP
ncbi:hypothetical protein Tco_0846978, partial [Tanacetum coccineum]